MKALHFINIILFSLLSSTTFSQNTLIPAPVQYQSNNEIFMFDSKVKIDLRSNNPELIQIAKLFTSSISSNNINFEFKKVENPNPQEKSLLIDLNKVANTEIGDEGYELEVRENQIKLLANKPAGIFYGIQTLKQMLPAEMESKKDNAVPFAMLMGCKIKDYPRFGWRGLMLDVSRHFFTIAEVKSYIELMSKYKFNVLHWHLTDDEGWRIEIKSMPKLSEIGGFRVKRHGRFGEDRAAPKEGEKATEGGFYTQEEIKDLVKFASERSIKVIPEIDVPGHSMALLAAYPELSTKKEPKYVNPGAKFAEWFGNGQFKMLIENTINPSDEKVYQALDKIFTEVAQIFPAQYIHVGGDEAYHGYWEQDPGCQAFMKKNNLKNTHELQSYFMKRVEKIISSKGKKMIGWDEILEGGLAEGAAVMSWRGMKGGIEAAKQKHEVVMSPTTYGYIDFTQGDPSIENKIYASLSLKTAYEFEPIPEGVEPKYILGGQANLWTELVPTIRHAFYMTYPRAFATAESVWSPKESKNWESFVNRTENHFRRFDVMEQSISKAIFDPIIKVSKQGEVHKVELRSDIPNTEIYYTIDNTFPDKFSTKYSTPIELPAGDYTLKTINIRNGQVIGRMLSVPRKDLISRAN